MSELDYSPEERLKQLLKILDTFFSKPSAAEMQQLANEAKRVVNKMQNFLERSLVEQVAELVQAKEWDNVTEKMKQNFPGGVNIGKVEEILELVYLNGSLEHFVSALHWVGKLDVKLQPRAYESLYEQLKFKRLANQPEVLLVRQNLLVGQVSDNLQAQLDEDFQTIVGRIVEGVKKEDFSLQIKISEMRKTAMVGVDLIINEVVTAVLDKFKTFNFEETLLLIQYSTKLPFLENCCIMIDVLMKMLEARKLLGSKQAFLLWSHAKFILEEQPNWKDMPKASQKLCADAVDKLTEYIEFFFKHYQKYVEEKNNQKLKKLHQRDRHLRSIVSEFVSWYYKKEDLSRVQNLLSAARATNCFIAIERILTRLQIEMDKFQQMNTFEAFCLFNMVKLYMALDRYKILEQKLKASYEELKAKAPTCLRLLLWPDQEDNQLQLVNKFYDSSLCIQQDKIICSNSTLDKELLCSATIDPVTALTTFSFKSGIKNCKLDAVALEDIKTKKPWIGTQWKLKAIDDTHVKIFADDGERQFSFVCYCFPYCHLPRLVCNSLKYERKFG